jgi:hypothetical protein
LIAFSNARHATLPIQPGGVSSLQNLALLWPWAWPRQFFYPSTEQVKHWLPQRHQPATRVTPPAAIIGATVL